MKILLCFFIFIGLHFKVYAFYSEHGQDEFIFNNFFENKKDAGVFVDIGVYDGVQNSNTYFFEKQLNWSGVCIEPSPIAFHKLRENRKCACVNAACSNIESFAKFLIHPVGLVNVLSEFMTEGSKNYYFSDGSSSEIIVKCMKVNDILDSFGLYDVDFLSIDSEGAEMAILESIDFDRFNIKVIAVEGSPSLFSSFFSKKQYKSMGAIGNDSIFVKLER